MIGGPELTQQLRYEPVDHPALHPGVSAKIIYKNQIVGICGAIHPGISAELGLNHPAMIFELDCMRIRDRREQKFKNISKYPAVRRDISILVDKELPVEKIMAAIKKASPKLLDNLELFDVYLGEGIEILKKSLALGLIFQASSSTLTDEEVKGEVENILAALISEFDVKLRE